jgi:hypothetical protein
MGSDMTVTGWRATPAEHLENADRIWYVSYGSNMSRRRLGYYFVGGRPPGGSLNYPGCRDPRMPEHSRTLKLAGQRYFALDTPAWTGGMAFFDPDEVGSIAARAYLITVGQFSDVLAQELCREPGTDVDLSGVLDRGRDVVGPGCYERLVCVGSMDGIPMITFTAPWGVRDVDVSRPSVAYLRVLAAGLREAHGWRARRIARYLSNRPGAAGHWSAAEIMEIILRADVQDAWSVNRGRSAAAMVSTMIREPASAAVDVIREPAVATYPA